MIKSNIKKISFILIITLVIVITIIANANRSNNEKYSEKNNNTDTNYQNEVEKLKKNEVENFEGNLENIKNDDLENSSAYNSKNKDFSARAIYITGSSAGNKEFLDKIINMIKSTELNAVVLDIKEDGKVNYKSEVKSVVDIGAHNQLYDVGYVMKELKDNDIYVIGRIVCFRDNHLAMKRADLAIKRSDGSIWKENNAIAWTNPYNHEVWKYNIEIAREAVKKGFDEIQFDYVRFPTASKREVHYGENMAPKADVISGFLKEAAEEIHKLGVPVSADIFAIVCESPGDTEGIGQVLERIGMDIDYISPMIYPSHYANNSNGMMGNGVGQSINGEVFKAPDLKPYEVVYNALLKTKDRISKVEGYKANVRPYLQGFTASYLPKGYYQVYGPDQIKQQIQAVYDAGYDEWIIWDATNSYNEEAFSE
ncbi:UNVERIFIED_CONTAM: hypothetical protein Cloal_2655 [Acetivibrio alkalicellulosi]